MSLDPVRVAGRRFVDSSGREMILRGVNLGGDCKVPYPDGGTHVPADFSNHRNVSFVGRPFPLDEAAEHFGRLRHWGFNTLRLLTTWEAIEHAGPGRYDEEYLDYFAQICHRANEFGFYVFIDSHQDVWSRMTGGDGAPGWTLDAVGLDFSRFDRAGAAHVMQWKYDYRKGGRQDAYPQMSWGSNGRLAANGIMWNLFFAGRLLTPDFLIDGRNVQDYLQGAYLGALLQVARRVSHLPNVLGFDTMNEPHPTWLGQGLSYRHLAPSEDNPAHPRPGLAMSALDALASAQGVTVTVPRLTRNQRTGRAELGESHVINPERVSIWRDGCECPFERAGAYRIRNGQAEIVNEDFFRIRAGRRLSVSDDAFGPLFHEVARTVRTVNPEWAVFAEIDAHGAAAGRRFPSHMPVASVNASHWYDTATLHLKTFDPCNSWDFASGVLAKSPDEVRERFVRQLRARAAPADTFPGGAPTLIGEFGIPFDLDHGAAYRAWAAGVRDESIWDKHVAALSLMYDALDQLLLHSTHWNYTATNRNDLMIGDGWNQEDLSIFSRDQQDDTKDPHSGGRALKGYCRPYVQRAQGTLVSVRFRSDESRFVAKIAADARIDKPTLLFVPQLHFPRGARCATDGVDAEVHVDPARQLLYVTAKESGALTIELTPA